RGAGTAGITATGTGPRRHRPGSADRPYDLCRGGYHVAAVLPHGRGAHFRGRHPVCGPPPPAARRRDPLPPPHRAAVVAPRMGVAGLRPRDRLVGPPPLLH